MMIDLMQNINVELLMQNSFKNFHAKGLDYICLKRTPKHTVKIYLLDGDASKIPEVVNPHDHRYKFSSKVLYGSMADFRFVKDDAGEVFQAFDYMTPLNGGDGFTFRGEERLKKTQHHVMLPGDSLVSLPDHTHTISMISDQTVLLLEQFEDVVPLDKPTSCWVRSGQPAPETSGLYEKFTEAELSNRISFICNLIERSIK